MNPVRAVCFLWHFPSGNPWEVPVSRFHGTRCLVMSGLSSTPARRPEQQPPEPDRHGLHTLSAARGKAQSRQGGHFCSSTAGRHPEQGRAATGSLPWPLQLTTYENQLDPLIRKGSLLPFRRTQPITARIYVTVPENQPHYGAPPAPPPAPFREAGAIRPAPRLLAIGLIQRPIQGSSSGTPP